MGKSDDWYTPAYIFDALDCVFDIDVAAPPPLNEKPPFPSGAPRPGNVPADASLSERSLQRLWHGFVWMNPPFGGRNGLEPWLEKFFNHGNGIALVPDRTSAPWFQKAAKRANALLFVSPKVKFERPDGTVGKSPGCGTVLMSAGPRGRAALFRAGGHLGFVALPNEGAEPMTAFPRSAAPAGRSAAEHTP